MSSSCDCYYILHKSNSENKRTTSKGHELFIKLSFGVVSYYIIVFIYRIVLLN